MQNQVWALESLNSGIELARRNRNREAIKYYKNSLELDEDMIDTYVSLACA